MFFSLLFLGKDPWLLNSLVDAYFVCKSDRLVSILGFTREPHDKVSYAQAWDFSSRTGLIFFEGKRGGRLLV